jgi:hypothetical protein
MPISMPLPDAPSNRPIPAFSFLIEYMGMPFGDWQLEVVSWTGVFCSLLLVSGTVNTFLLPLFLWGLYLSIVNLETILINYGWEWLTLEAGFLAIFLCPTFSMSLFPAHLPPPASVMWLFKWLAFRLLIGAGMSKMGANSSDCWKDLTCTFTHYETQPMPNLFSWFMHRAPAEVHQLEVALTFFEQLVLPFFLLVPLRSVRLFTALAEMVLQAGIVATGNYAWINFIGALPCLALLDDRFFLDLGAVSLVKSIPCMAKSRPAIAAKRMNYREMSDTEVQAYAAAVKGGDSTSLWLRCHRAVGSCSRFWTFAMEVVLFFFIMHKSVEPIKELYSPAPWLHYYDDYFFVNSQGVFGFINQERVTLVLQCVPSFPFLSFPFLSFPFLSSPSLPPLPSLPSFIFPSFLTACVRSFLPSPSLFLPSFLP